MGVFCGGEVAAEDGGLEGAFRGGGGGWLGLEQCLHGDGFLGGGWGGDGEAEAAVFINGDEGALGA